MSRIDDLHARWLNGDLQPIDALVTLLSYYERGKINDHLVEVMSQIVLSMSQEELDRRLGVADSTLVPERGDEHATNAKALQEG